MPDQKEILPDINSIFMWCFECEIDVLFARYGVIGPNGVRGPALVFSKPSKGLNYTLQACDWLNIMDLFRRNYKTVFVNLCCPPYPLDK